MIGSTRPFFAGFAPIFLLFLVSLARGNEVELKMKDGRVLRGSLGPTAGVAEQPQPLGKGVVQPIFFIDDYLRRTFVSKHRHQEIRYPKSTAPVEPFLIRQRPKRYGKEVGATGFILGITPFDEFGRRTLTMRSQDGPVDVVQGITEMTPAWVKIEGITHRWELRVPTNSIPPETLATLLSRQPGADTPDQQKRIARFYLQMERYEQARDILEAFLKRASDADERSQIETWLDQIRQLIAQRIINELKMRRDAGQFRLAAAMFREFPTEGVAGEILQEVRELIQEHQEKESQRERIVAALKDLIDRLGDSPARTSLDPIVREIENELSGNTVGRLAAFRLAMGDEAMNPAERLALAVSGWLLGSDAAATNLPNALSAFEARRLVAAYLNETSSAGRAELMERLGSQEAAVPRTVALLLENMKPPLPSEPIEGKEGYFELEAAGLDREPPIRYLVQTPPEYDPYRTYPTIVTLHAAGVKPEEQLEWWSGPWNERGQRVGQAGRHGYIVIAPNWLPKGRSTYGYSASEHAAVLNCLRDACRRFSVDTDRVYLSGHSVGGEAAWDIGLAHPDLWAGVIPITARVDRYIVYYSKNAKLVPLYFVGGEKDAGWLLTNAVDFDRYFKRGYDTTVVEYVGRGSEHYYDEILRLFDWMGRFKRDFYPNDFSCVTMRPWDNFFWWVEIDGFPEKSLVEPANWPPPHGSRPIEVRGRLLPNNNVQVRSGAARATIWLSPKMVDFDQRVKITLNGRAADRDASFVKPDLATMLEDARTRADRHHPFWAKVEMDTGRKFGGVSGGQ